MAAKKTTGGVKKRASKKSAGEREVSKKGTRKGAGGRGGAGGKKAARPGSMAAKKRDDFMQPGHVMIDGMAEPKRAIARGVDAMIRRLVPECASVMKWGHACYSTGAGSERVTFAVLIERRAGVNLALPGMKLPDPEGLLEGTGKLMRHVKINDHALLSPPSRALEALIKGAVRIGIPRM